MAYPRLARLRQKLDDTTLADVPDAVAGTIAATGFASRVTPGQTVAITAGSRGITDIVAVTRAVADEVRRLGAEPIVVPAMGSHGGASADGQARVLANWGLTEAALGAPIRSSMDTVDLGKTESGVPVVIDSVAHGCDHVVVVNRIKPHTEFHGQIESGLVKMMVIGLGNHQGALNAHNWAVRYGYERTLLESGRHILAHAPISLGVGIVENGLGRTARIVAADPETFVETEKAALEDARERSPKLPFDQMDVLIVDEIGKSISGTGMDTKVIGRIMNIYEPPLETPRITRIVLRDLVAETDGNALGLGLADFITRRAADRIDTRYTWVNCVTAVTPEKGRMPIICETDREAVDFALATAGPLASDEVRLVRIRNTMVLDEMWVSEGLVPEARGKSGLEILTQAHEMNFDASGNLMDAL